VNFNQQIIIIISRLIIFFSFIHFTVLLTTMERYEINLK